MAETRLRVLLVEDNPADVRLILHELAAAGIDADPVTAQTEAEFVAQLQPLPDIVLCDYSLPQFDAVRALEILKEVGPQVPLLIVSGSIGEETAVNTIKLGATDYLLKDRLGRLGAAVKLAIEQRNLRDAESRAHDALRQSEEQYRSLAESVPHIVWTARPDGAVEYINRRGLAYAGLDLDALAGWAWERVVHDEDIPVARSRWNAALMTGEPHEFEFRLRRHDGEYRWHVARQLAIRDHDRSIVRWFGTCTDIHDNKLAAQRLEQDALMLASVRDSVIVTDLAGVVTYWNAGAAQLFGWAGEEMIGRAYADRLPASIRDDVARPIVERWLAGDWEGEYEDYRKDGARVWIHARIGRIIDSDQRVTGIMGVSHDITERRKLEEQFRQAQKMEAIGQLAGGIAHDFNNLLTVINGYAEMLLLDLAQGDPSRDIVSEIHRSGERAAALTRQLLAFSRRQVLVPAVLDLNRHLDDMERLLGRLIGADIDLRIQQAPDLWRIESDPGQIEQVIMNLVINARDAMPRGGQLTIRTQNVEVDADYAAVNPEIKFGQYVLLSVDDTGHGMDEATKSRIFEPFFTTKEKGKGTGLGLATIYGIVRQSGGHIDVMSEPGVGTSFKIHFPRFAADAEPRPKRPPPASLVGGNERILLVDDEPGVRAMTKTILESLGYSVVVAANGHEAIRSAQEDARSVDLVLTDVVLPDMHGPQLWERLAELRPGLKVLFFSGYSDDAVAQHGFLGSNIPFLQKPFKADQLARKVREILDASKSE